MGIVKDIKNLVKGLSITSRHLGRHAVTIQYPEERWEMPERSRGIVVLLSDKETGDLNCTACELCMRACPTAAIKVESHRDENKKKILDAFVVDNALCCFCGLCEEACNFCAIKLATKYEFSSRSKEELVWDVKKLQEIGRDVPYVDTRKKKPKPEAKPAPKPAAEKPGEAETEPPAPEKPVAEAEAPKPESDSAPRPDGGSPADKPMPNEPSASADENKEPPADDSKNEGGAS